MHSNSPQVVRTPEQEFGNKTPLRHEFHYPTTPATPTPSTDDRNPFNFYKNHALFERKRVRTDSVCSNKSSIISKDLQKIRRLDDFGKLNNRRDIPNKQIIQKKEKSALTMKDMIYYNPRTNPMSGSMKKTEGGSSEIVIKTENIKTEPVKPAPPTISNTPLVPQLKLGPNGEMILDESSLVVENIAERDARQAIEQSSVIYDDGSSGKYGIFKRQKRTRDWNAEETIKFYRCLHTIGTDFSLMLQLFPNRTRRDLKIKFKKEEKSNGHLVDKALCNPKAFDVDSLRREFEKEDAERAEKQAKLDEEAENKRIQREALKKKRNSEVKQIQKSNPQKWLSRTSRSMTSADEIYAIVDSETQNERSVSEEIAELSQEEDLVSHVKQENRSSPVIVASHDDNELEMKPQLEENDESEANSVMDDLDWDSLVLCTAQDDAGNVTYAVYLRDPNTGNLGKEPLDLPSSIIDILKQHYEEEEAEETEEIDAE
ncbi:transcription factor TFIIIB component B'' homolog [Culicoides brevitarsis]|uniref:transcription factor TFIIIB component B'' homolog n=1 Tax=Culicoides brevitarsis TaxID=469753 RepID=UPI00307C9195